MTHAYLGRVPTYLANLLGAVSLALVDGIEADAHHSVGHGGQTAGALVLLDLRPRMSIKRLAERLRMTHPGAVRLVDRLAADGLVARRTEGRVVRLELTERGRSVVDEMRRTRMARLDDVVSQLSTREQRALEPVLERLARVLTSDVVSAYANCRLCDVPTCEARGCPVEAEARARFGAPDQPTPDNLER
jgi:MarR family transcriptional regulator, negative regulator of the multidrug operon emrRAB